jgi:hypothetical protein
MVRPSTISLLVLANLLGLMALFFAMYVFTIRNGGKLWFDWIAPLLLIGFFAVMVQLAVGYWIKVGRLETKGRRIK